MSMILNDFGVIHIQGSKANAFLQGQLTCDINQVSNQKASLAACCDYKGRVLANFFCWGQAEDYYLLLPTSMIPLILEHLKKYAMFSKVVLEEMPDYDLLLPMSDVPLPTSDIESYQSLLVEAGIVFIEPATSGLFIPQMLHLQKLGGISFKKGCYVGQEVIARTEHRGQLKRHLYRVISTDTTRLPSIGGELMDAAGQAVGVVASTTILQDNSQRCLAVIQDTAINELVGFRVEPC